MKNQNQIVNFPSTKELGILTIQVLTEADGLMSFKNIRKEVFSLIIQTLDKAIKHKAMGYFHSLRAISTMNSNLTDTLVVFEKTGLVIKSYQNAWQLTPGFIDILTTDFFIDDSLTPSIDDILEKL